ncbi:MAG TPA: hypothetical protein RMF84_00740 [Polyangiaceae bacterium LLY-WYZ-14_1]|nr:hypothetical protein [Polyangiaceae bacterium LLY-WYZ-14_1]
MIRTWNGHTWPSLFTWTIVLAGALGCGDDRGGEMPGDAGPGASGPAPSWNRRPMDTLRLVEGATLVLPLDPGQDVAEVGVEETGPAEAAGLHVRLMVDPDADALSLALRAPLGASPGTRDAEILLAAEGGEAARFPLALEIVPLGWERFAAWDWESDEGPEPREHGVSLATEDGLLVLQGSGYFPQFTQMLDDAWRFDRSTETWVALSVVGELSGAGSRRAAAGRSPGEWLLFGGYQEPPVYLDELVAIRFEPGEDRLTVSSLPSEERPFSRGLHAFVKDPGAERWIAFGGVNSSPVGSVRILPDTWELTFVDGEPRWRFLELEGEGPTPRYGFFYGVDPATRRLIVWSGGGPPTADDPVNPADDTWALDLADEPPTWRPLFPTGDAPRGRRNGCSVFDPALGALVVIGGTADGRSTVPGVHALELRGPMAPRWVDLGGRVGEPPLRSSGFGTALGGVDEPGLVCGFGNGTRPFADLAFLAPTGATDPGPA